MTPLRPFPDNSDIQINSLEDAIRLMIFTSVAVRAKGGMYLLSDAAQGKDVQSRYNRIVEAFLDDEKKQPPTPEQLRAVVDYVRPSESNREYTLRVRLTEAERVKLQEDANKAGMNLSDYVRSCLFR